MGSGSSRRIGIWTHDDVKHDMTNYWLSNHGDYPYIRDVSIENIYMNGLSGTYKASGSSRIDIVITNNSNNNVLIGDLKTGSLQNHYGTRQQRPAMKSQV